MNGKVLIIKVKYKRKNSHFYIASSSSALKRRLYTYRKKIVNMVTMIITGFEDYSYLFISSFMIYFFSIFCTLYIILLSIFKRRKKVFGTRYSYVILGKLVITMIMATLY